MSVQAGNVLEKHTHTISIRPGTMKIDATSMLGKVMPSYKPKRESSTPKNIKSKFGRWKDKFCAQELAHG